MRMYTAKILFYWRYTLIIALALIALNTIPPILDGIANGNKKALRENISEAQKGEYVLSGYINADYTRAILTPEDLTQIDKMLKNRFPDIYKGYRPLLKGQIRLSLNPNFQYSTWVEADDSIDSEDTAFLSSNFHPNEPEQTAKYRVNEINTFKNDIIFKRVDFEIEDSSNPFLLLSNGVFSFVPDVKASFPVARRLLDYPDGYFSSIVLLFSTTPTFSELEEVLSESFTLWSHSDGEGFSSGVFKALKYSSDTVLFFKNLDDDLMQVTMELTDNGQASRAILEIVKTIERSRTLSVFFTVSLSVILFMTMVMEAEARKAESKLTIDLGGTYLKVVYLSVIEKGLLALYALLISALIILLFSVLYSSQQINDPVGALFTRGYHKVFSFDILLSFRLMLISFLLTIISSVVAVMSLIRRRK